MSAEIPKTQDPTQEIANTIQNVDVMSGYIAGMSAKSAIEIALSHGRVEINDQDIVEANNYGNNLGIGEPQNDAEVAMFEAGSNLSNNGIDLTKVSKVDLSTDFKIGDKPNDEVIGFLLGYIAQSPTLTSSQRLAIVNSGPEDTKPRGTDFQTLKNNLEYCLGEAIEGQADPNILLPSIPREFGMREAVAKLISEPTEERSRLLSLLKGDKQVDLIEQHTVDLSENDGTVALDNVVKVVEKAEPEVVVQDQEARPTDLLEIEEDLGEVAVEDVVDDPSIIVEQVEDKEIIDPNDVDISHYLNDPETLMKTLNDRDIDPGLRADLRKVVGVWQELQHSELAKTLWQETIAPKLDKLNTDGLKEQSRKITQLREMVDEFQGGYRGLANLLGEPRVGMEDVAQYLRRHNMGEGSLEEIKEFTKRISEDETPKDMIRALGMDTEEADIMVRKLGRKIGSGEVEPDEAEKFINQIQQYGSVLMRKDLTKIVDDIGSQIKFVRWKNLVGNLEDLMHMAKRGSNELQNGPLIPTARTLERVFHDFKDQTKRGQYDPQLAFEVSKRASLLSEELERPLRLTRISSDEASWLTR